MNVMNGRCAYMEPRVRCLDCHQEIELLPLAEGRARQIVYQCQHCSNICSIPLSRLRLCDIFPDGNR